MLGLKKGQLPILITNVALLIFFSFLALKKQNYEFVIYILVIVGFLGLIIFTNKKSSLPNWLLWGLTLWALLHMMGGLVYLNGTRLYEIILINLVNRGELQIFRYDQFVHIVGFGVATLVGYTLLEKYLNEKTNWKVVSVLVVLIGMGIGAFNEIVEFLTVVIVPATGVGGYENTMMDIISNTIGAIIAVIIMTIKRNS